MSDDDKARRDAWLLQARQSLARTKATQLCACCKLRPANCANRDHSTTATAEESHE